MGAALTPSAGRKQPEPEINITPLVDVVLVLLIIFMVIAPALEHGERVELPAIQHPDKKQKGKLDPITVTIASGGKLFYEKEPVDMAALQTKLVAIHTTEPDRRVVLKGDASVPYGQIRDVFGMAQKTGFPGIALLVSKKGKGGDGEDES